MQSVNLQLRGCVEAMRLGGLSREPQGPQGSVTLTVGHFPGQLLVSSPAAQDSPLDRARPGVSRHEDSPASHLSASSPPLGWLRARSLPPSCHSRNGALGCTSERNKENLPERFLDLDQGAWVWGSLSLLGLCFSICATSQLL